MSVINWLLSHEMILGGLLIAILDFLFAIKPDWASNGVLHSIYLFLKNIGKPSNGLN